MFPTSSSTSSTQRRLLLSLIAMAAAGGAVRARAVQYEQITWDALVPQNWDPMKSFADMQKLGALPDSDKRVQALYDKMRKVWDEAPTVPAMAGRDVKIPGFIVSLEGGEQGINEFLLVPYFGACIHTPPPPANQIIHVHSNPPARGFRTMSAVWVSGTLKLEKGNSHMGASGYSMQAKLVEKYKEK